MDQGAQRDEANASALMKTSLDKDLKKLGRIEEIGLSTTRGLVAPALALVFLALAGLVATLIMGGQPHAIILIVAAVLGGYMAMNIGANDVANNVGPAVGSRALTMVGALAIAAIFECAGALIAGGDVVKTISKNIIDPSLVPDSETFIWIMMSALLSSALWVNLATYLRAPVSTTHSVVGGVVGAGIVAVGAGAVNWMTMSTIVASWVISPLLGGVIAALFLSFIKNFVIYRDDKIAAARRWVPVLIAIMTAAFSAYLMMKGLKHVWKPGGLTILAISMAVFVVSLLLLRPMIRYQSEGMENRNQSLRKLFHIPLIFSAALLSFAHGANDVANAVGPLAAIFHSVQSGTVGGTVGLPVWVMLIGGAGISLGLLLFGPRLIRIVGEQITKMNPMRAYCVALSAAITVIIASSFGLPVSSTHIAVGAVFGVGFFREYYTTHSKRRQGYVKKQGRSDAQGDMDFSKSQEIRRRKLVRRSHFMVIISAWLITVPAAGVLSAVIFLLLSMFQ